MRKPLWLVKLLVLVLLLVSSVYVLFGTPIIGGSGESSVTTSLAAAGVGNLAVDIERDAESERVTARFLQLSRQMNSLQSALTTTAAELQELKKQEKADIVALRKEISGVRVTATMTAKSAASHAAATASASPNVVTTAQVDTAAAPTDPTKPALPLDDGWVRLTFIFDATEKLGDAVELYWLSGNATERLYATIPAGQRVVETTMPGQCWRARTKRSGQHVASYCASSAREQEIRIEPHDNVQLYFHFPSTGGASALSAATPSSTSAAPTAKPRAAVYELIPVLGAERSTLVGHVTAGGHFSMSAKAGSVYRVRDETTGKVLLERFVTGYEAEQHVDISGTRVNLEFELHAAAASGADLFWLWGENSDGSFAREHRYASLETPGQKLTVPSAPGETWIVRQALKAGEGAVVPEVLLTVTAADAPETQRHVVVVPPPAPQRTVSSSGQDAASRQSRLFPSNKKPASMP